MNAIMINYRFGSFVLILSLLAVISGCKKKVNRTRIEVANQTESITSDTSFTAKERLGKLLFFEPKLSTPEGQACSVSSGF